MSPLPSLTQTLAGCVCSLEFSLSLSLPQIQYRRRQEKIVSISLFFWGGEGGKEEEEDEKEGDFPPPPSRALAPPESKGFAKERKEAERKKKPETNIKQSSSLFLSHIWDPLWRPLLSSPFPPPPFLSLSAQMPNMARGTGSKKKGAQSRPPILPFPPSLPPSLPQFKPSSSSSKLLCLAGG